MEKGCLAIVLHAHLPFVRHPEHENFLEENWLYEAITETYVPLLLALDNFIGQGIDFRLTMSLSPPLGSMLIDPLLQTRYVRRIEKLIELAEKEIQRTAPQPLFNRLARFYHHRLLQVLTAFVDRYHGDLVAAFRRLQDSGKVEIIAGAATHGYLPLLSVNESAVRAQIRLGVEQYRELFGRDPRGFWLPECGFYPGVDRLLHAEGIRFTILETHGITRASPRPGYGVYAPVCCPSGVAVFGRDPESSRQVWSAAEGYPGDHDYREFYRDIGHDLDLDYIRPYIHGDGTRSDTGFKYFRITGKTEAKEVYDPLQAERKADLHAQDFLLKRCMETVSLQSAMDRTPIIVAPFDAELFGHWWFEGVSWLSHLIRKTSLDQNSIRLTTLSEYLLDSPPSQVATPCTSSWGRNGFHETWLSRESDWIYPHLHHGAEVMERLAVERPDVQGAELRALNQASRELLLAQSSDWAFMINCGTTAEYAVKRTRTHLLRLNRLKNEIETAAIDEARLSAIEEQDNIFPNLDYRIFCPKSD
jgi:1,4-alpha-glucan branching enzyme